MTSETEISNSNGTAPISVTVAKACELTGLGPTTIWNFLKSGRLVAVRMPGVRRTLVSYASLVRLLSPSSDAPQPRKRGRPRKMSAEVKDANLTAPA